MHSRPLYRWGDLSHTGRRRMQRGRTPSIWDVFAHHLENDTRLRGNRGCGALSSLTMFDSQRKFSFSSCGTPTLRAVAGSLSARLVCSLLGKACRELLFQVHSGDLFLIGR